MQFDATREAMKKVAADPNQLLGSIKVGSVTMLHGWGQLMLDHLHTHMVLPAGGFRTDGSGWVSSEAKEFFLNEEQLADTYRDEYIKSLLQLHGKGALVFPGALAPLADESAFRRFLKPMEKIRWVVHCGSPEHVNRPEAALEYLSRYVVGSVISNSRIVSDIDGQITIRIKDYRNGGERTTATMSGIEFVRRFMLHIMPLRMSRVRYAGFMASRYKERDLASARARLGATTSEEVELPEEESSVAEFSGESGTEEPEGDTNYACPHCGSLKLRWVREIPATHGWHSYVSLMPRAVRERLAKEAESRLHGAARPPP